MSNHFYKHSVKAIMIATLNFVKFPIYPTVVKKPIVLLIPPDSGKFYYEIANEVFNISGEKILIKTDGYPKIKNKMASVSNNSNEIYATIINLSEHHSEKYFNILNILSIETSFYTLKKSNKNINTVNEVKNLDGICVWLDSALNKYLINQGFKNLIPVPTLNQCAKMLFEGKVDAFYASDAPLIKLIKANGYDLYQLKKGYMPMRVTFFLAVTKNASNDLVKRLSNSGRHLLMSGRYDEILEKHKNDLFLLQ